MLQRRWYPSSLCLLLLLLPLLLLSSGSVVNNTYNENCSNYLHCGDLTKINVTYPFRLLQSPSYCGYPGYELNCSSLEGERTQLTIELEGHDYAVNFINYDQKFFEVVDSEFIRTDCPLSFTNASINSTPYNYASGDNNLTVYLNCSFLNGVTPLGLSEIKCMSKFWNKKSYYEVEYGPPKFLELAVDYCEQKAFLQVYDRADYSFVDANKRGFGLTWDDRAEWCKGCMDSGGICRYDETRPRDQICFCSDTNRRGSCFDTHKHRNKGLIIGVTAALACLLLVSITSYFCIIQRNTLNSFNFWKKNKIARTIEVFLDACENLGPKRYKYSVLRKITKSFSEKLGQGGYGAVFKGKFPDGPFVAVKILSDAKGNGDEFVNEVASIGRTSHVNVVSLLGFSSEGSKRALIYEFMPNGSLDKYIYSENLKFTLGWEKLYQIAVGIARGLEYLHRGCNTRIVHFDIKPHNILLDQDFCPKISDFGLAQLCLKKDSIFSDIDTRGTIGYIAPEVFSRNFGVVSSKSDVYSYGMMILEMVGVRNTSHSYNENDSGYYFPHWIYDHFHQIGHMECLSTVTVETEEIVKKMILVGLWCIQTKPGSRPSMGMVVDMLQSSIADLEMPPKPTSSSP